MSRLAHRWTAAVIAAACAAALAGCSADPDDGPVVINSGSSASSAPGTFMTLPTTSTSVATAASPSPSTTATSPDPADVTDTEDPSDAEGPDSSDSSGGTGSGDTETSDEPGPGTVIYRGTTYVMPPEETTPLAESLVVTFNVPSKVDAGDVDIDGAEIAYKNFVRLSDEAVSDPGLDWESAYQEVSTDPALTILLDELATLATSGVRIIGHSKYAATVTHVSADSVHLKVCVDNRGHDIVDSSGHSVSAGAGGLHPQDVRLVHTDGQGWLVAEIVGFPRKSC